MPRTAAVKNLCVSSCTRDQHFNVANLSILEGHRLFSRRTGSILGHDARVRVKGCDHERPAALTMGSLSSPKPRSAVLLP